MTHPPRPLASRAARAARALLGAIALLGALPTLGAPAAEGAPRTLKGVREQDASEARGGRGEEKPPTEKARRKRKKREKEKREKEERAHEARMERQRARAKRDQQRERDTWAVAWGVFSVGGVGAAGRGAAAAEALPWRAREESGLYPARADVGGWAEFGALHLSAEARLAAAPWQQGAPLSPAYVDPRGVGPGLNTLSLSRIWYIKEEGVNLILSVVGGWLQPDRAFHAGHGLAVLKGYRTLQALDAALDSPLSLLAAERRWSRAPSPLDRVGLGGSVSVKIFYSGRSFWSALASFFLIPSFFLTVFTPTDGALPAPSLSRDGLVTQLNAVWGFAPPIYLDLQLGRARRPQPTAAALLAGAPPGEQEWLTLTAVAPLLEGLRLLMRLTWRDARSGLSPLDEARLSGLDRDGGGRGRFFAAEWGGRLKVLGGYEWLDPQTDFAYNTRHALTLSASYPLITREPWRLELDARYTHLWSSSADRLSFGSDLAVFTLTWRPLLRRLRGASSPSSPSSPKGKRR